jgi:hypothetical protein
MTIEIDTPITVAEKAETWKKMNQAKFKSAADRFRMYQRAADTLQDVDTCYFEVFFDDKLRKYYKNNVNPQNAPWFFLFENNVNVRLMHEIFEEEMKAQNIKVTPKLLSKYARALERVDKDPKAVAMFFDKDKRVFNVKLMTAVATLADNNLIN